MRQYFPTEPALAKILLAKMQSGKRKAKDARGADANKRQPLRCRQSRFVSD
jgi:hypothetical protein